MRLGAKISFVIGIGAVVSIPAWCDWEGKSYGGAINFISFNSSLVRLGGIILTCFGVKYFVSIPAWCDWEDIFLDGNI